MQTLIVQPAIALEVDLEDYATEYGFTIEEAAEQLQRDVNEISADAVKGRFDLLGWGRVREVETSTTELRDWQGQPIRSIVSKVVR